MEKKLQEMENIQEKLNVDPLQDNYHDILEFAENHFNAHERSPEGIELYYNFLHISVYVCVHCFCMVTGTIIATLKRKSKSLEKIPMYEMVSFHRGSTIPTSHIHMYDPDNITIAISIFRVSRLNYTIKKLYFLFVEGLFNGKRSPNQWRVYGRGDMGVYPPKTFFLLFRIAKKYIRLCLQ